MIFFIKIKSEPATQYYQKYSTILSINIKDIIICVVSIIIFLLLQSIHLKKNYYLCSKYHYFSYNSKYSYQNIIICVLNIIIFLIIQRIHIKYIIICVTILLFL
jgi:hypothetical protein